MFDSILYILFALLFFLTPLVMSSSTSELFEFNKMILIYILTILIVFIWLWKMVRYKTIILKKTFIDIPLFLFFIIFTLSTFFSIDFHTSVFGYYGRFNGGWLSILTYIILFYAFVSNINRQKLEKLFKSSIISSILVILWGLPGKFGYDLTCFLFAGQLNNGCWTDQFHPESRIFSTLGQPNWMGAYLAVNLFLGIFFLLRKYYSFKDSSDFQKGYIKKKVKRVFESNMSWEKLFWFLYITINFIFILFTRSRSAILSALVGVVGIIFSLFIIHIKLKKLKQLIPLLLMLIIVFIIPAIIFKTGIEKFDNIFNLTQFSNKSVSIREQASVKEIDKTILISESFDIRKIVWEGAIELGKKYPILGTGPETFAYSYYFVRPVSHNYVSEWDYLYNKAHNEFLNYYATTGLSGLISYCLVIVIFITYLFYVLISLLKRKLSNEQDIKIAMEKYLLLVCLSFAYFSISFTNFFGFSTTTINLFFFLIPAFFCVYIQQNKNLPTNLIKEKYSNLQIITVFIISFFALFSFYSTVRYWFADTLYAKADLYTKTNDYQSAMDLLYQALKLKYEHVYEDKLSYSLANLAVLASYQKKTDIVNQLIAESNKYGERSLKASPKNVLYWKTMAKNYYLFYQLSLQNQDLNKGINALLEAKKYAPTDPKIPYSLAVFYSLMYDGAKGLGEKNTYLKDSILYIDECLALKNDYRDGYFLKGQLLKKYNMKVEAKKTFQYIIDKINDKDTDTQKELKEL